MSEPAIPLGCSKAGVLPLPGSHQDCPNPLALRVLHLPTIVLRQRNEPCYSDDVFPDWRTSLGRINGINDQVLRRDSGMICNDYKPFSQQPPFPTIRTSENRAICRQFGFDDRQLEISFQFVKGLAMGLDAFSLSQDIQILP